jgi:hypothetical protein
MFQKAPELRISGRVGDAAVERKILGDRVLAALSAASIASRHWTILRIWGVEACAAARPAASISIPVRNSITSSTARSGDNWSKSMRNGRRAFSGTNAPTPCRVTTSPSARSAATASRTTVRLTPVAAINACSVGNWEPAAILPLVISSVSRATSSPVKDRGAGSGRIVDKLGLDRLRLDRTIRT